MFTRHSLTLLQLQHKRARSDDVPAAEPGQPMMTIKMMRREQQLRSKSRRDSSDDDILHTLHLVDLHDKLNRRRAKLCKPNNNCRLTALLFYSFSRLWC